MVLLTIIAAINLIAIIYLIFLLGKKNDLQIQEKLAEIKSNSELIMKTISNDLSRTREETSKIINESIKTTNNIISSHLEQLELRMKNASENQGQQIKIFSDNLNLLTKSIDSKLKDIMENNDKKLEQMRQTVDEKLQSTLEKRLSESFKSVSDQLENVYKGLGEMRNIAGEVGDLKRVLTNVKSRGIFGEIQLKNILDDILTKEQYEENVRISKGSIVEFAIKIPSKDEHGKNVLLPIDAKYPRQDYEKILDAQQKADTSSLEKAVKALADRVKSEARDISEKYINPPETTDFALLFLPSEGLFAEVLRIPGFFEDIRKNYSVIITGPTTITAILNSLQMGFRTLAIEKRSYEVWKILGSVKKEFQIFGDTLAKTRKKLEEAADNIEKAEKRSQIIGKKLKNVEIPTSDEKMDMIDLEEKIDDTSEL
ncbi:MAG: DNA recombination protein RmuC [Elusimicrobiota bacterium]